jgi:hypothetical protein
MNHRGVPLPLVASFEFPFIFRRLISLNGSRHDACHERVQRERSAS